MNRFQFVADHQHAFEVKRLCQAVEVSRSSFYAWCAAAPGPPPSFGPVAVRVVGFRLMGALPSVVDGCEVAER